MQALLDANGSASLHADKQQTDRLFKSMCAYVLKQALALKSALMTAGCLQAS